jgi:hypothetical protein
MSLTGYDDAMPLRSRLPTWAGRSTFEYEGSLDGKLTLHYGKDYAYSLTIDGADVLRGLKLFADKEVPIGTSRTQPPPSSLGKWLLGHVTKTAIASYLGPILIAHGYAERGSASDLIRIRKPS